MQRMLYIVNHRLPTEKAYGLQIAKMCEAFADQGLQVTLLHPFRKNLIKESVFNYYGIRRNFMVRQIWSPDFYLPGRFDYLAFIIKYCISTFRIIFTVFRYKPDIIYSRDELPLFLLSWLIPQTQLAYEAHRFSSKRSFFYKRFLKKNIHLITISAGLKREFVALGFNPKKVIVAHDGVDLSEFRTSKSIDTHRNELGLPQTKQIITYVGNLKTLGMKKGVGTLLQSFALLREQQPDALLMIVGGTEPDIQKYKNYADSLAIDRQSLIFTGHKSRKTIPAYLAASDVLAMPFPFNHHYAHYMSPLKLFEYMAAQRPIVASDLPTIREIVDHNSVSFVLPDDSTHLTAQIIALLSDKERAQTLARNAYDIVKRYTWHKRAQKILKVLS